MPPGAPVRVYEWLVPPAALIVLAALEWFAPRRPSSHAAPVFSFLAVTLLVAAGITLWIAGYRAYRDLTARAVERYRLTGAISLGVLGVLLSVGTAAVGLLPLFFVGRLLAESRLRPIRLLRTVLPRRRWRHVAVVAALVGVVTLVLQPVASGLGSLPLVVVVDAVRIMAPVVAGFALRL